MEDKSAGRGRDVALTLFAPIVWGTTYLVTQLWLPPQRPLFTAAIRALPIGVVMLLWRRTLPTGSWWWKAALLGVCNFGLFFALLFVGAYRLPGGLASTLQATGPLLIMAIAWLVLRERPSGAAILGGILGVIGVGILVLRAGFVVDGIGVAAALGSVAVSSLGFVLIKKWTPPVDMLTFTTWQLVAGGLFLTVLAALFEGPPPEITAAGWLGYAWIGIAGTGVAYLVWFRGLRRLSAASVGTLGLVNPLVATLLGITVAGEAFGPAQAIGVGAVLVGVLLGQPAVVDAAAHMLGRHRRQRGNSGPTADASDKRR